MYCINNECDNEFPLEELCFYRTPDDSIHLMVKYERAILLEGRFEIDNETVIKCLKCKCFMGKKLPIGPKREDVIVFGRDKVSIKGDKSKSKKERWSHVYKQAPYSEIVERDSANFRGHTLDPIGTSEPKRIKLSVQEENGNNQIIFPESGNTCHFEYTDILKSDIIPKDYQVTAYIEALQRDLILVLPTGYGKTLVASICAARMKQLNPQSMVLFIVDRVPLVYQQGEAINIDTNLNVCTLTSESNTNLKHRLLNQGHYDVLVATAGAYKAIQNSVGLHNFCYVIFDECHHAVKGHIYVTILRDIEKCQPRPRLLGLTASPPSSQDNTNATIKLLKLFRENFFSAPICHDLSIDCYQGEDALIEKIMINQQLDKKLVEYQQILESELTQLTDSINSHYDEKLITKDDWKDKKNRSQLITNLYGMKQQYDENISHHVSSMKKICKVLDVTEMLGVTFAHQMLSGLDVFTKLDSQPIPSPRLLKLLSILQEMSQDSKVIVFVDTRRIASILTTILKENNEINEKYSPKKIVGQSGPFGMNWLNDQEEIIESFRDKNCNLLVSTSVLEEGLDIPGCNVVIRLDGIQSLISFKQSKGRARKLTNSMFILILSEDQKRRFEAIQAHESQVKQVLRDEHSDVKFPSQLTETIQGEIKKRTEIPICAALLSSECALELYISGTHDLFDIQDKIAKVLFEPYFLKVKRIESANSNARWKSNGIFPFEDSLIHLGLQTQKENIYQRYKRLTEQWDFTLGDKQSAIWSRVQVPMTEEMKHLLKWGVHRVSWGKFNDKHTFQLAEELEVDGNFELFHNRYIELALFIDSESRLDIEIQLASIHLFVLANWTSNDVTLYLPLSFSPRVQTASGEMLSSETSCYLPFFGESPVFAISLTYNTSNWSQLWLLLHSSDTFLVPVFDSKVSIYTPMDTEEIALSDHPHYWNKEVQDCIWEFYVLRAWRDICLPEETIRRFTLEILQSDLTRIKTLAKAFTHLLSLKSKDTTYYFFDLLHSFNKYLDHLKEFPNSDPKPPRDNYCYVECAMVTPSTVIPLQSIFTQCNRLYRSFPGERFLNLAFREEHGEALKSPDVIDRVKNILIDGVNINGIKFYFLVCSGSQLRSKRAVFIHISEQHSVADKIREIRNTLMGGSIVNNVTKYLSRLGLFCTSDHPICQVSEKDTYCLPDLFADNNLNLTDGNGKIKRTLAENIFEKMELKTGESIETTTAVQVRLAGLKGVFTIVDANTDPDFNRGLLRHDILYRKSMKKIEWTHSELCLVKFGKHNSLFLNTQMMTLLTSLEDNSEQGWDPKPRLTTIFRDVLEFQAKLFTHNDIANNQLSCLFPNHSRDTSNYVDILSEPFFLSLLRCIYSYNIGNLIKKFHIPLKQGCLLMGIPDPIGVLGEEEVFVTYKEAEGPVIVRTGRILVYKNPCLHPGDLLTPTAVDREELHHLRNVIVFPITGSTSLAACSGGGDLDGDEFGIIWDEELVPPASATFPPLNYDSVLKEYREEVGDLIDHEVVRDTPLHLNHNVQIVLAEAYCKIISNDLLGIISHYHVAVSDMKPAGAKDQLSIQLARLASIAVDSPKTGVTPNIPIEAKNLIKEKGYPDFMEKTESTAYPSEKLLGELYQLAKSVCFETSEWQNILNYYNKYTFKQNIPLNLQLVAFQIPGYEDYMQDAKVRYFEYSTALQRIMLSFGIETEAEAVLGLIIKCHPLLSGDKNKVTSALKTAVRYLTQEFRESFKRDTLEENCIKKAAAWYLTVYQQQMSEERVFLSFAWIMREYLCKILKTQHSNRTEQDLHYSIGKSAREYLMQQSEYISTSVDSKTCLLQKISSAINEFGNRVSNGNNPIFNVQVFGSVSKFLCELESDLDISVSLTEYGVKLLEEEISISELDIRKKRLYILQMFISPSLDEIAVSKINKFNLDFPFITFSMDSQHERRTDVSIDVTIESDGLLKSNYIKDLYRRTGGVFFGFFWILIHWARHIGILKCHISPNSTGLLLTAEFEALILFVYEKMENKPKIVWENNEIEVSLASMINLLMNSELSPTLGLMLEEFFRLCYQLASEDVEEIVYTWPVKDSPTHTIKRVALTKIAKLLFQGWHCLVYTRDIFKLFERVQVQLTFAKRFTTFMSDRIRSSKRFYERSWRNSTNAQVKIEEMGRNLLLTAQGSAGAIHKLAGEISLLESNSALTMKYRSNANHYMLDGSMLLVLSDCYTDCRVKLLGFSQGCCKQYHTHNHKSFLVSADQKLNPNWKRDGTERIQTLLWNQLSRFPLNNNDLLQNLKFKTRIGFFYVLDGPDSFQDVGDSLSLEEFEKCLLKGKLNRNVDSVEEENKLPSQNDSNTNTPSPSGDEPRNRVIKKFTKSSEKLLRSTSSGFCPGLKSTDEFTRLEDLRLVYVQALKDCGFEQLDMYKPYTWRVEIQIHFSFDIRINLSESLKVVSISERPLIWMLATIVANRNVVDISMLHDIRLRCESAKPLREESDIYKHVLPDGVDTELIVMDANNSATPCERLKNKMKIIKHNQTVEYYRLGVVTAKISSGVEYCRENFSFGRRFCELTLFHNEDQLRDAVKCENNSLQLKTLATNAVDISLRLSEAISSRMNL